MQVRPILVATLAAAFTASAQAELTINDNLTLDGYVIGSGVVTEGTPAKNGPEFGKSGGAYDSAYIGLNGNYNNFSSRVSLYSVNFGDNNTGDDTGILDAYVTYKFSESLSATAGKYLGYLGYESFHSPNNAFISFSQAVYASPFSTGAKLDYTGDGFSTGLSIRDSQILGGSGFFEGDGEFGDDIGYEAYVMLTSIDKLTFFAGLGYEDVDETGQAVLTYDLWASYELSDTVTLAAEYAFLEDTNKGSWLILASYAASEALSVSGRITGSDGDNGASDAFGVGIASTYTLSDNFALKGEITKTDFSAAGDVLSYALQGQFKF